MIVLFFSAEPNNTHTNTHTYTHTNTRAFTNANPRSVCVPANEGMFQKGPLTVRVELELCVECRPRQTLFSQTSHS